MFWKRLLTTLVLAPAVLLAIIYANPLVLLTVITIIVCLAAWEWTNLIATQNIFLKSLFLFSVLVCSWLAHKISIAWLMIAMFIWLLNSLAVLFFPRSQRYWGYKTVITTIGLVLLPAAMTCLTTIYRTEFGRSLIIYLLFLVWAADIGAYLAGKTLGRRKLLPQVSPGKTIEGSLGGLMLAIVVSIFGYYFLPVASITLWLILAITTVVVSVIGDLFVSVLKRRCGLKDTGKLIPGHGGVLDRIDSLIAAAPIFYAGLYLIG